MGKRTFKSRTFRAFTFKSRTCGGSLLSSLFCHPFTTHQAYVDFIDRFNDFIANPGQLSASDLEFLDRDWDGVSQHSLSTLDRDLWIQLLTRLNFSEDGRYPFGEQTPTTFEESDPLELAEDLPSGHQVVIIDPQNPNADKINRGLNTVKSQAGATLDPLWQDDTDSTYEHSLWYDLDSLDETNWDSVPTSPANPAAARRFPISANQTVTIYVRGGTQTLTKEIQVRRNNGNWQRRRIIIMGYPGDPQRPQIQCGSSLIVANEPAGDPPHADSVGGYRFIYALSLERAAIWLSGLEIIGYRGDPSNRVFAHMGILVDNETFGPEGVYPVIYDCVIRDFRGVKSDHPEAATYPDWVDSQYDNRKNTQNGMKVDVWDGGNSEWGGGLNTLYLGANQMRVERCHVRPRALDAPAFVDSPGDPDLQDQGDGIATSPGAQGILIRRCLVDGRTAHFAITNRSVNGEISYCDVSNVDHTCCGLHGGNITFHYNRVHNWTTRVGETDSPGYALQIHPFVTHITGGSIKGNVFYNASPYELTGSIIITADKDLPWEIAGLVIQQNVCHKASVRYGYIGNDHGTSTLVNDIITRDNAIVGVSIGNDEGDPAWDAPILTNLYQFPTTTNGIVWIGNLVSRDDGEEDATLVAQSQGGGAQSDYTLADLNDFTGSSENYDEDPKFTNPDAGDFTLQPDSPLEGVFGPEVPLVATPAWDEYEEPATLCGT